ncbi:glutamine-hydrolyzing carbamoyl-phosphate synthase small subunit [Candidatus Micrarchaeota archaeon]|nr:glutamine-hydrolyzing carbamoyl-phosphate synthase small subunit [Candidatus Micrarchaeota archaeon]
MFLSLRVLKNVFGKTVEKNAKLILEDGSVFPGTSFGYGSSVSGEVVFNTAMVGYPQSLTDPSYRGQILCLTYPLVGNYGIGGGTENGEGFESDKIHATALVVSELCGEYSHNCAVKSLDEWMKEQKIPGISGVDTRALTKKLRENGVMNGKIVFGGADVPILDSNLENLVAKVSNKEKKLFEPAKPIGKKIVLVDCGAKNSIISSLLSRGASVLRVPWDHDFSKEDYGGILISNGPGNPVHCARTIENIRKAMKGDKPIFGICLGNQLLALAAGAKTYKLKYGHRGQNQPCTNVDSNRCYITSQNHGYAVDEKTLPPDWNSWFVNANDGTNEGIRHKAKPFFSVQFHPEAAPGPVDTAFLFDEFLKMVDYV